MSPASSKQTETTKLFDASREIEISIQSGGSKKCVVRFPTDEELCDRVKRHRTIRQHLGRGKSETSEGTKNEQVDLELFQKIRIDADGVQFDEYDAAKVIERLDRVRVTGVERLGDEFCISMSVPGAQTTHTIRMPTEKQKREYQRGAVHVIDDRRSQDIRIALEPGGYLFDKCIVSSTGYAGRVPINHKSVVISELLVELEKIFEEDSDLEL
jgi:hypothetical protein